VNQSTVSIVRVYDNRIAFEHAKLSDCYFDSTLGMFIIRIADELLLDF